LKSAQSRRKAREMTADAEAAEAELTQLSEQERNALALLLRGGDAEPPGGPVASSIRRNTSAELSALGGASA
jgi:hypothetical protein